MMRPEAQKGNPARRPTTLSTQLNKGLVSYVAAASAAGVAMLAGTQHADAEVVYTPANTPILTNIRVGLDLNNDGTVDFQLSNNYQADLPRSCTVCSSFRHASLVAKPAQAGNAIWAFHSATHHPGQARQKNRKKKNTVKDVAAPVFWGAIVGPERKLDSAALLLDSYNFHFSYSNHFSTTSIGAWGKGRQIVGPYLGLKFTVGGEVHYGWARLTVHANGTEIKATLTGYAYETIPNRPIITGLTHGTFDASAGMDPAALSEASARDAASLGRLAQGATGLAAWRVSQAVAQNAASAAGN
jgi:hypothetical protein